MDTIMLYFVIACLLLLALFSLIIIGLRRHDRKVEAENLRAADDAIRHILEKIGWESTERWVSPGQMEFVSIIIGQASGEHRVWARVQVTKTRVTVVIEYVWNIESTEIAWVNMLHDAFQRQGITTTIKSAGRQPHPEEIWVPPQRQENEFS